MKTNAHPTVSSLRLGRARTSAVLLLCCAVVLSACQIQDRPNEGTDLPENHFGFINWGYGHETHLLFSFDGDKAEADKWRDVSKKGIADDPRIQRFVDEFRRLLAEDGFVGGSTTWREERALGYLSEPMYLGGMRLSDAHETVRQRSGRIEKYYRWHDRAGNPVAGAFPDELGTGNWRFETSLSAEFGRRLASGRYTDHLKLHIAVPLSGWYGWKARSKRQTPLYQYGVMCIIAPAGATTPPPFVQQVIITISTAPKSSSLFMDALVAEALNACVGEGEVVQFFPHSGIAEPGDTDHRVRYLAESVTRSRMIPEE